MRIASGKWHSYMEGLTMLWWLYIAAAGVGALRGLLWLRLLAILTGSVVLVAGAIVMAALVHWPPLEAVINVFLLLATLQVSYLVALLHANSVPGSL